VQTIERVVRSPMPNPVTIDDAAAFLMDCILRPRPPRGYASYGYEIYLPNVIAAFLREIEGSSEIEVELRSSQRMRELSPYFYDAAWELCRRGILRPGIKVSGAQAAGDGDGYSITALGDTWLKSGAALPILIDGNRLGEQFKSLSSHLGDGFLQRAAEAVRCHSFGCYLAACAMSGAAAESVLLSVAVSKTSDEAKILKIYQAPNGRRNVIDTVVATSRPAIARPFQTAMGLLSYWRDDAAHGLASDISEIEAHDAIARLLRLAQFVQDNWAELTTS
jgi:hypothetical protein